MYFNSSLSSLFSSALSSLSSPLASSFVYSLTSITYCPISISALFSIVVLFSCIPPCDLSSDFFLLMIHVPHLQIGFRTFPARPIFSEANLNCEKHKFERFWLVSALSLSLFMHVFFFFFFFLFLFLFLFLLFAVDVL